MSSINSDTQSSPFDTQDTCCKVVVTGIQKTFCWDNCMNEATYWTLNFWTKAETTTTVTLTMGDKEPITINVTTEWQRVIATVNLADLDSNSIYIDLPIGTYYFYNSKLEKGNRYSDYSTGDDDFKIEIQTVRGIADGKSTCYYSDTVPTGTFKVNDTWFNSAQDNAIYTWNGTEWIKKSIGTGAIAEQSITNALIADATITNAKISNIDAGKITTGYLLADRIANDTIISRMVNAGSITTDKLSANAVTADKFYCGLSANLYTTGYDTFEQITNENIGLVDNTVLGCYANIVTESPWYGTKCLKLHKASFDGYTGIHLFADNGTIKVTPNSSYIVTFYIRSNIETTACIEARYGTTKAVWSDKEFSNDFDVTTSWARHTFRTTALHDYLSIYFEFYGAEDSMTACNLYIDAIQIESDPSGLKQPSDFKPAGTTVINGGNIVTNSITASQIAAKTITSNEIHANSITAAELSVSQLSSISADIGTITAGIVKSSNYIQDASGLMINFNTGQFDSKYIKFLYSNASICGFEMNEHYIASKSNADGTGVAWFSDGQANNIAFMAGKNVVNFASAPYVVYQNGDVKMNGDIEVGGYLHTTGRVHVSQDIVLYDGLTAWYNLENGNQSVHISGEDLARLYLLIHP